MSNYPPAMNRDVTAEAVDAVIAELGLNPSPDDRIRAETAVRLRLGGDREYFRKTPPKEQRYRLIAAALEAGMTYREAAEKYGVSERTAKRAGKFAD